MFGLSRGYSGGFGAIFGRKAGGSGNARMRAGGGMTGKATSRPAAIITLETPGCRLAPEWRVKIRASDGEIANYPIGDAAVRQ